MMRTTKRHRAKWQREIEPVFPGYVFVRLDLERDWLPLRRLHGHVGLVQFGGTPASVADELIEEFRQREGRRGYLACRPRPVLCERDRVRIVTGPLRGSIGIFLRYAHSPERVFLLLEMMRLQATVEVPSASVEKVAV